jgi:uncharacterized membrane protein YbaN (DUF454 family)
VTSARPRRRRSKAHNLFFAAVFFVLGVIGVLVPVMPQVVFFVMSALFLSLVFPGLRRKLRRWRHKYPKFDASYRKWRDRARRKRQKAIRALREASRSDQHHS